MWEAFEHAAHYELDNLTAIIDVNRLGQRGETMVGWDLDVYVERAHAFGWHAIPIDGHDVDAIDRAYAEALATTRQPTVIVARTIKGKGVQAVEDVNGFHGKPLDDAEDAIAELGGLRETSGSRWRSPSRVRHTASRPASSNPLRGRGEVATRKAYGDALAALGSARGDVVVLDGEVSNSTFADTFAKRTPTFFEMYIAEQQMVAAAVGLQTVVAAVRLDVRGLHEPRVRLRPHGSREPRPLRAERIPRGGLDRRGRPLADGARGHRGVSGGALERRPPSVRREPDGEARRSARRRRRDRVPPDAASRDARPLRAGRAVRDRRQPSFSPRTRTRSRSWAQASPCTRRSPRRTSSPRRASRPG